MKPLPTLFVVLSLVAGCASSPIIEPASSRPTNFDHATYGVETIVLDAPTPGTEQYRVFQEGASIDAARSSAQAAAAAYCARTSGKAMHGLKENLPNPPYTYVNFPKIELEFECAATHYPAVSSAAPAAAAPVRGPAVWGDPPARGPAAPVALAPDKYDQLFKLKKLLDSGVLTQKEFDAEKAKLLGSP